MISEIAVSSHEPVLEFIELFNTRGEPPQGFERLSDRWRCRLHFPAGTSIAGGGFVVVAKSPVDLQNTCGISGCSGHTPTACQTPAAR